MRRLKHRPAESEVICGKEQRLVEKCCIIIILSLFWQKKRFGHFSHFFGQINDGIGEGLDIIFEGWSTFRGCWDN
ncbi:hypothetical protein B4U37_08065 [Sutcliffiella horikoshii]|uniref:Uncharacterized protein n=1 Tax=Sutcliffiella horikoshii TaxID=79883 RepID=A0ABN4ZH20_9BACI|nr:hypothetical protein B4U37_08065 [Sutcliffiella horikoshii]